MKSLTISHFAAFFVPYLQLDRADCAFMIQSQCIEASWSIFMTMRKSARTILVISLFSLFLMQGFAQDSFPNLEGKTLTDVELVLPQDFSTQYNLILMPFDQNHQADIDVWATYAKALKQNESSFDYYQILLMGDMNFLVKGIVTSAMKGSYDEELQAQSMPLFIEQDPALAQLGIANTDQVQVLLIQNDSIIWRSAGAWSEAKAAELEQLLN